MSSRKLQKVYTNRLELFNHLYAVAFHLPMNLAKLCENFTGSRLQLTNTDGWKDIAKIFKYNRQKHIRTFIWIYSLQV